MTHPSVTAEAQPLDDALPLPTRRDEAWRYAPVQAIGQALTLPHDKAGTAIDESGIAAAHIKDLECITLCFAQGKLLPSLSNIDALPEGLSIEPQAAADSYALPDGASSPAQRAQALAQQPYSIRAKKGTQIAKPLHIITYATAGQCQHYRLHVELEADSHLTLMHTHVGQSSEKPSGTNIAMSITLGKHARLQHYTLQQEPDQAVHLQELHVELADDAHYQGFVFSLGAHYARHSCQVVFSGEKASASLQGAFIADGMRIVDHHIPMNHDHANCYSEQRIHGVLYDKAQGIYYGRVEVPPHATETEAHQHCRGLLLSPKAEFDARPELAIETDAVQCSHGVAIGKPDSEVLYYLKARGLDDTAARQLLVEGFIGEIVQNIPHDAICEHMQQHINAYHFNR